MSLFISIFGSDGSGKSTHARILARYFMNNGYKVKIVWIKSHHTLAYLILRIFAKISSRSITLNQEGGTIIRINTIKNSPINHSIWSWIEFISILPWIILRIYLPLLMGKVVIAERYLVDSIVSIAYFLNNPNFISSFIARIMLCFIPKNSILIHLDSNYEEIKRRRGDKADSKEFINFQRFMYSKLSKRLGAIKIDTSSMSIEETAERVRSSCLNLF
ncbi:MAG: hypothetical protein QXP55_03050 [Nitrososphaerales archaeon]